MADKKDISNKDMDSLDDFDWPDFDFDDVDKDNNSKDRKPVARAAKSALKAAGKTVTDPALIERTLKRTLPGSYGEAVAPAADAARQLKGLYDTSSSEINETVRDMRKTLGKVTPGLKGKVPDKLYDRLQKMGLVEEQYSGRNIHQERSDANERTLDDVFGAMAAQNKDDRVKREGEKVVARAQAKKRFATTIGTLQSIDQSLNLSREYQDKVDSRWKRKSLELSLQANYLLGDLVDITQRSQKDIVDRLGLITKNTALPEAAKIQASEEFARMNSQRLLGKISEGMFGSTADYIGKTIGNLSKNINTHAKDKLRTFRDGFRDVGDVVSDMNAMGSEGDGEIQQTVMELLFGAAGDWAGNKYGGKVKDALGRNSKLMKGHEGVRYWLENAGRRANEEAHKKDYSYTAKGWLKDAARGLLHKKTLNGNLSDGLADNTHMPDNFNKMTNRSLIEIIPGLLARIHQEQRMMRTGDESTPLIRYNVQTGTFTDSNKSTAAVRERLVSKSQTERNTAAVDDVLKDIDPSMRLGKKERAALSRHIVGLNMAGFSWNPEAFAKGTFYGQADPATKEKLYKFVADRYKIDGDGKIRNEDSRKQLTDHTKKINALGGAFQDPTGMIKGLIDEGHREELINLGVIDISSGKPVINYERMVDFYLGKGITPPESVVARSKGPHQSLRSRLKGGTPGVPGLPAPARYGNDSAEPVLVDVDYDKMAKSLGEALKDTLGADLNKTQMEQLIEATKKNNLTEQVEWLGLMTEEIMDILMDGRQKVSVLGYHEGDRFEQARHGLGARIRKMIPGIKKHGGSLLTLGRSKLNQVSTKARGILSTGYKGASDMLGSVYKSSKDYVDSRYGEIRAIYIKGKREAALTLEKLKNGDYIDEETGKVITRLSDITGRVRDKISDTLVIDFDDIKAGLRDRSGVEFIIKGSQALLKKAGELRTRAMGGLSSLTGGLSTGIGKAFQWAKDKFDLLPDVYVKGETEPRLLKVIMDNEGYLDKKTKKPIKRLSDITGDIIDINGNKVLSLKDMRKGLVDQWGRPIKGGIGGILNRITGVGNRIGARLSGAYNAAKKFVGKAFGKVTSMFGMGISSKAAVNAILAGLDGTETGIQNAQLLAQLQILENVIEMNPRRKRRGLGEDESGVRVGSYADQMRNKAKTAAQKAKEKIAGSGGWASMKGAFDKLKGLFAKKKGDEDDDEGGDTNIDLGDSYDIGDKDSKKKRRPGKKPWSKRGGLRGMLGKAGDYIKNSRLGGWVSRQGGRMLGGQALRTAATLGGSALLGEGLLGGGAVATTAAAGTGIGSALLGGAAAVGTGILSILASPIVLTGLAVAAVGLAAYGAYKWYDSSKDRPLQKLRLAQYGWDLKDDDQAKKLLALEGMMMEHTHMTGNGPSMKLNGDSMEKAAEIFGIDASQPSEDLDAFLSWLANRFKPVFYGHLVAMSQVADWKKLGDIDDELDADKRKSFLSNLRGAKGIVAAMRLGAGPFGAHVMMNTNIGAIEEVFKEAETKAVDAVKKDAEPGMFRKAVTGFYKTAASLTGIGAIVNAYDSYQDAKAGAPAVPAMKKSALEEFNSDPANPNGKYMPASSVDALRAVRFKTYGLVELERNWIRALIELEQATAPDVAVNNKGTATYRGDSVEIAEKIGSYFSTGPAGSPNWSRFINWFEQRFLPVYLKHVAYVYSQNPSMDPGMAHRELDKDQQYELAQALLATTTTYGGNGSSVWSVPMGPSPEGKPNMDRSSTDGNMAALKDGMTQKRLDEEAGKAGKTAAQAVNPATGMFESVKNFFGFGNKPDVSTPKAPTVPIGVMKSVPATTPSGMGSNAPAMMKGMGGSVLPTGAAGGGGAAFGGQEVIVDHPGGGTQGDINKLAFPSGMRGFEAHKELLAGVAQMTGFDPSLLAGVIATESNFDSSARPGTSAAQGLGQFIPGTWQEMMQKYARQFGISPDTPATDPRANALMTAMYMKQNAEAIKGSLPPGKGVTDVDLYMAHFLGAGGYKTFLKNPGAIGAKLLPAAANSNASIFYDKGGRARTVEEIIQLLGGRVVANRNRYAAPMQEFAASYKLPSSGTLPSAGGNVDPSAVALTGTSTPLPSPTSAGLSPIQQFDPNAMMKVAAKDPGLDVVAMREANNAGGNIVQAPIPSAGPAQLYAQRGPSTVSARDDQATAAAATSTGVRAEYDAASQKEATEIAKQHLTVALSMDKRLASMVDLLTGMAKGNAAPRAQQVAQGPMSLDKPGRA